MLAKVLESAPNVQRPFAAFIKDEATRAAVAEGAASGGFADPHVVTADLDGTVRRLGKMPTPRLLVVDLTGSSQPVEDLGRLAEVCDEGTQVIAVGDVNDINLYRDLMALGVREYLVKPVDPVAFGEVLRRVTAAEKEVDAASQEAGRLISVVGARGGVGATTIACNIAWTLANEHGKRVALVDLDLFFGTCGLTLDLDIGRGFREALENPSRIDGLFIERAMVRESDNLFVLTAEEGLDYMISFDPSSIELLIDHLRRDFEHVIIDLPRFAARSQVGLFLPPSMIGIVSEPTLAGMRDAQRLHQFMRKTIPNADVSVILNRVGANKGCELDLADFQKSAELTVDTAIPFDAKLFAESASNGKPLAKVKQKAKAVTEIRAIAHANANINGRIKETQKKSKSSFLAKLLEGKK